MQRSLPARTFLRLAPAVASNRGRRARHTLELQLGTSAAGRRRSLPGIGTATRRWVRATTVHEPAISRAMTSSAGSLRRVGIHRKATESCVSPRRGRAYSCHVLTEPKTAMHHERCPGQPMGMFGSSLTTEAPVGTNRPAVDGAPEADNAFRANLPNRSGGTRPPRTFRRAGDPR